MATVTTVDGLPAHILLNHFVVVLGPLTAILAILCALWPAARRRLIWLVLVLSVITLVLTPLTTSSGAWLVGKVGASPPVRVHAELGETLIYLVASLLAALILLAAVHIRQARGRTVTATLHAVVGVLVIAAAVATMIQTYRIGDSGARAAWGNTASGPGRANCSATARRSSEPFAVCGRALAIWKLVGTSKAASRSRQKTASSAAVGAADPRGTITAATVSPYSLSGTPNTATSKHVGVAGQHALDALGRDFLAAPVDEFLDPAADGQLAIRRQLSPDHRCATIHR